MDDKIKEVMGLVEEHANGVASFGHPKWDEKRRKAIESKLRELVPVWLPIESAPKTGEDILVLAESNEQFVCYWDGVMFRFATNKDLSCICVKDPTHWMPLPKEPVEPNR